MKALLVDDHPMVFSELQAVVASLRADLALVLAGSVEAARSALCSDADFDLVLIDLRSDEGQGLRLLAELRSDRPDLPVIAVSSAGSGRCSDALTYGAASGLLFAASRGRSAFAGHVSAVNAERSDAGLDAIDWRFRLTAQASLAALGLTARQQQVLALIVEGRSNKAIAQTLYLSVDTVKDHVTALLRSLKVRSRSQAVLAVVGRIQAAGAGLAQRPN